MLFQSVLAVSRIPPAGRWPAQTVEDKQKTFLLAKCLKCLQNCRDWGVKTVVILTFYGCGVTEF